MIHVISETQNGFKAEFLKVMSSLYDVGLAQLKQRYWQNCFSSPFCHQSARIINIGLFKLNSPYKPNVAFVRISAGTASRCSPVRRCFVKPKHTKPNITLVRNTATRVPQRNSPAQL